MADPSDALTQFHLLRPWWLLAIPVALALLWWSRNNSPLGNWAKVIDARWLPFMLASRAHRQQRQWPWAAAIVIAALALSGPTWQQAPQPLHKMQGALVAVLDLSPSMQARDVKPDRISRARHKLRDILQQRKEGQTALVVYGGTAHVVTPLTGDTGTIVSQLSVLRPDLISTPGSNIEEAVELARQLLTNSGYRSGDLLLVTDGIATDAVTNLRQQLSGQSLRLSILGVGTAGGAPVSMPGGGFAKDRSGNILVARLERRPLLQLTRRHNGQYSDLTADDQDLELLQSVFNTPIDSPLAQPGKRLERSFDNWRDQGYWLAVLLLPLLVLAFRRGLLACLLLAPALMPEPAPAADEDPAHGNFFQQLIQDAFQTKDQQGQRAFQQQQFQRAQRAFATGNWKGSAAYRNGDFETALDEFKKDDSATGLYNQGNALAQSGQLDDAIEAYRRALQKNPDFDDAAANKKIVEELKKQRQNQRDSQNGDQHQQSNTAPDNDRQQAGGQQSQQDSQQKPQQPGASRQSQSDQEQSPEQKQAQQRDQRQDPSQQVLSQQDQSQPQDAGQPGDQEPPSQQTGQQSQPAATEQAEAEQAMAQFLRKVPDNPGAFLRKKFRLQQQQRQHPPPPKNHSQRW